MLDSKLLTAVNNVKQDHSESTYACMIFKTCKWEIWIFDISLYPCGNWDHSQNLMGSKFNQDPSHFYVAPTSCILDNVVNKQTNRQRNK